MRSAALFLFLYLLLPLHLFSQEEPSHETIHVKNGNSFRFSHIEEVIFCRKGSVVFEENYDSRKLPSFIYNYDCGGSRRTIGNLKTRALTTAVYKNGLLQWSECHKTDSNIFISADTVFYGDDNKEDSSVHYSKSAKIRDKLIYYPDGKIKTAVTCWSDTSQLQVDYAYDEKGREIRRLEVWYRQGIETKRKEHNYIYKGNKKLTTDGQKVLLNRKRIRKLTLVSFYQGEKSSKRVLTYNRKGDVVKKKIVGYPRGDQSKTVVIHKYHITYCHNKK